MPIPAVAIAAGIGLGGNLIGNAMNAGAQQRMNAANRKWQEKMYGLQRQDALADWQMQADYNSPKEQMRRLREAGLNANLVYGHGADATMGDVRSSSPGSYSGEAPRYDFSGAAQSLAMMYDLKLKNAQVDNLAAARAVQEQDVLLRAAQTLTTLTDNRTKEFDLKMKNDLKAINVNMAAQSLNKLTADVGIASTTNQLMQDTFKANADKAKAEAKKALNEADASNHLTTRVLQEIDNLKKDGDLRQFEIDLRQLGINQGDPTWIRIITQLFGKYVPKF